MQTKNITFQMGKTVHAKLTTCATGTFYEIDRHAYSTGGKLFPYHAATEELIKQRLTVVRITRDCIYAKL